MASNVQKEVWTQEYNSWLGKMSSVNNDKDAALVHSDSTTDAEKELSLQTRIQTDVEFQKACVWGLTLMFSSGDSGI